MKILLIGDASGYHATLAQALAARGHQVTVASHGSRWMDTARNIDLGRRPGKLGGAVLWLKLQGLLASTLKGYDVVHVSNPVFVELRPHRVRQAFDKLKRGNGNVFLTMMGTDSGYIDMCMARTLRYTEWAVGERPSHFALANPAVLEAWRKPPLSDHCKYIYDHIDGVATALYEYHLSALRQLPADMVQYAGIPISPQPEPTPLDADAPVRIMAACHRGREVEKGFDIMMPAVQQVVDANPGRVALDLVQNVPYEQFKRLLSQAHIVVDQLYSYSPATTALMAMARGKVVVSGGEPEYYDFIGEQATRTIINAEPARPESIAEGLQRLIDDRQLLAEAAIAGPEFVMRHNDADLVAARFEQLWERRMR